MLKNLQISVHVKIFVIGTRTFDHKKIGVCVSYMPSLLKEKIMLSQFSFYKNYFIYLVMLLPLVISAICVWRNCIRSLRKTLFLSSGHPFIGLLTMVSWSHFGVPFLTDVPGIFFPVSSCTHQQYPADL